MKRVPVLVKFKPELLARIEAAQQVSRQATIHRLIEAGLRAEAMAKLEDCAKLNRMDDAAKQRLALARIMRGRG